LFGSLFVISLPLIAMLHYKPGQVMGGGGH
jgi:hypothetical protein